MRTPGPTARAILEILDPGQGGVLSADYGWIQRKLGERGVAVGKNAAYNILARLCRKGKIVRVETDDGGAMFYRADVLVGTPGLRRMIPHSPALKIRRTTGMSDRRYELAERRAINRFRLREVTDPTRVVHDHSNLNRSCPVKGCWAWPPEKAERWLARRKVARRVRIRRVAGARRSGSGSASRAKSGSRAGKRGT